MTAMKQDLAPVVEEILLKRFGNLGNAAQQLGFSYHWLRYAVQKNSFDSALLEAIFPDRLFSELLVEYDFKVARQGKNRRVLRDTKSPIVMQIINPKDAQLLHENKLLRERVTLMIHSECELFRELLAN